LSSQRGFHTNPSNVEHLPGGPGSMPYNVWMIDEHW